MATSTTKHMSGPPIADDTSDPLTPLGELTETVDRLEAEKADLAETVDRLEAENAEKAEAVDRLEAENAEKAEAVDRLEAENFELAKREAMTKAKGKA